MIALPCSRNATCTMKKKTIKPEEWLWWKIEDEEDKADDSVFLPKNDDDEEFSPDMLETDQLYRSMLLACAS